MFLNQTTFIISDSEGKNNFVNSIIMKVNLSLKRSKAHHIL